VTTAHIVPTRRARSVENRPIPARRLGEELPQAVAVHLVAEALHPVDLHERDPRSIPPLELGVGADVDELVVVAADRADGLEGRVAEVAARRGVEDDAAQG
jgi:hypothetical protein